MSSNRRRKNWLLAARGSGHFPLTFNFIFIKEDKYIQCSYCGRWIYHKFITRDHIWPKSLGGTLKVPSCEPCNIIKEDRKPIEFAIWHTQTGRAIYSEHL